MILRNEILLSVIIIANLVSLFCSNNHDKTITSADLVESTGCPVIRFDTTYHDFGTLVQGEQASFTFKFKNIGTSNLIINDAYSTCGCTVPDYSKEPLALGKEGRIEVVFNSEGKRGLQYKTVTLKLNTKIKERTLSIKANVLENNYKS